MTGPLERLREARPDELIPYDDVVAELRSHPELTEQKTVGTFHRGSRTFLHFHSDGTEVVADVKVDGEWERIVVSDGGVARLLKRVDVALGGGHDD